MCCSPWGRKELDTTEQLNWIEPYNMVRVSAIRSDQISHSVVSDSLRQRESVINIHTPPSTLPPSPVFLKCLFLFVLPLFNILWKRAQQNTSVQSLSRVWLFATPWTAAHQASLSIINSQSSLKFMPIESVMPSNLPMFLLQRGVFDSFTVFSSVVVAKHFRLLLICSN